MNDCPMKVTEMYSVSFTMKGSVICSLRDKHCERPIATAKHGS